MALAELDDLAALGAVKHEVDPSRPEGARGNLLLQSVSDQVCSWLNTTEAALVAGLSSADLGALKALVAEVAARRIVAPASATSDQLGGADVMPPWYTSRLTKYDKAALLDIYGIGLIRQGAGSSGSLQLSSPFWP
ncbi:MAG: hypothetical protein WKF64_07290 [Ilumatobacteraceae bacterium]